MLNNVRRKFGDDEEITVTFLDNDEILPIEVAATPEKITVKTEKGEACYFIIFNISQNSGVALNSSDKG